MNSASSSGGLVNSNNNDDSGSNNCNDNCNSCLKSFCIYCPSLSGWKEERAMDNILFFFPPHTPKSTQMNHVGFCIGASCLTERFAAVMPVNEIRTSHGIISLCCPFPDLWIVVEVTAVYDSSAVLPIIRLGFDAFLLRYGRSTVTALVSTDGSHTVEEVRVARASLKSFFDKFTLFLQTRVFVLDIRQAVDMSICTFLSTESSSSSTLGGRGGSRNSNSNRMSNVRRCKRRWAAVANAESLLAFPVFIRVSPQAVQFMCHSLIYRQLSLFLTELSQSNGGHGSSNSHNNNNSGGSGCSNNNKKTCTTGWGQEYQGMTTSINLSELNKTAEERLVWTCCKYIVFAEETLKVIVSNASHKLVSQFISLLLMEADLSNFTTFVDNKEYHCFVCRSSAVILALLVNSDLVSSSTHDIISLTCRVITDDIGEYLATGSCTFLREGYQGPVEIQRMTLGSISTTTTTINNNCGDSTTNTNSNIGTISFFSAPPEFSKLRDTKLTFQWTVWYDGMIIGSPMREYPRVVHLLMSSIMRTVIQRISDVSRKKKDGTNNSHLEENSTPYISLSAYEESCNSVSNTFICRSNLSEAIVEIWTPLHGATWLCVTQQHGRVGGIVFYNCASLKSCFEAVSELRQYMSLLV